MLYDICHFQSAEKRRERLRRNAELALFSYRRSAIVSLSVFRFCLPPLAQDDRYIPPPPPVRFSPPAGAVKLYYPEIVVRGESCANN